MSGSLSKHERMQLRRDLGFRKVNGPQQIVRSGGPEYLISHACFVCRKSWKRKGVTEHPCPECGLVLSMMGRTFKAPSKRDKDQWKKVELLWQAGFRFWSYRSFTDAEPYPGTLREVEEFIRRNRDHPMRRR